MTAMRCDFCHEAEAVLFIEQNGARQGKRIQICMDCALRHGFSQDPARLPDAIRSIVAEAQRLEKGESDSKKLCPSCGMSLAKIKRSLRAGCPECYEAFKDEIKEILRARGAEGPYTGLLPARSSAFRSVMADKAAMEAKLAESVKKEDYEKAAFYRDCLRAMERQSVSEAAGEADGK